MTAPQRRTIRRVGALSAATVSLAMIATTALAADTLPWTGERAPGPNQPYQHGYTVPDVLDWDPAQDRYAELLRARVPLQSRIEPLAATQRDPGLPAETQLVNLAGDYGNAFFESHQATDVFAQNLFTHWQYNDVHASWHGMPVEGVPPEYYDPSLEWTQRWFEFGMLNLPNPAYTNAAHRNGVQSLATIFFSSNDRGDQSYRELLQRDADGSFPVVAKLTEIKDYFGFDGYFVNQEELAGVDPDDVEDYKDFLAALRAAGNYVQWYDSTTDGSGDLRYQNEFNQWNSPFVVDEERGRISDSIFLNYWWDRERLTNSRDHAESLGLDPHEAVFAGVEAGLYQFDQPYDLDDNLDENGDPMNSIALLGSDFVHSDYPRKTENEAQHETFDRERRWWSGSDTGDTTPDGAWRGISSYIAERSVIDGEVFSTDFSTGHGLSTWVDGELSDDQEWGDYNRQDIPPTWQWWIESDSAEPLQADFDHGPGLATAERFDYDPVGAHDGGSSLVLSGDLDADTTLRLFKTDLDVTPQSRARLTFTKASGDDSELRLAVVLADDPERVHELAVPRSGRATDGWRTAELDLSRFAGRQIATLGVVVGTGAEPVADYQLNLGGLDVVQRGDRAPAAPTGLRVEERLPGSDEAFVAWDLADYDEVRRYELYLDDRYLTGGYDAIRYVKNLDETRGTLRLVAVGHDGRRSQAATLRLDSTYTPTEVDVAVAGDGSVTVSWPQEGRRRSPAATVTIRSLAGDPVEQSLRAATGQRSVTFEGLPRDGSEFTATVDTGERQTPTTVRSFFVDTELEPYPAEAVSFEGTTMRLSRPTPDDWHTLEILVDGEPVSFATTYNQGERPYWIRGRVPLEALSVEVAEDARVEAVLRDYTGNVARSLIREGSR